MVEQKEQFDVVVVGLGPTGGTLANLLGDMGLTVLVLEREADIYDLPRAVHFDDEIMRTFQWIGIAEELSKNVFVNKGMRFVDSEGKLLVDWPRPQELSANGWHPSYRFHQPDLERILRSALTKRKTVTTRLLQTVKGINSDAHGVDVNYEPTNGGTIQTVRTKYVVGCDGARSIVRRIMGSDMEHLGFEQRWLVVDVLLRREMPELGDFTLQFCDTVRPATYCRNVGLRRRWEFALLEDEDDKIVLNEEYVWNLLSRWIMPGDAVLERSAVYTFKSEVAETWVAGRLCLAGDAAHLTPPFLGQGMCAGIRDVANLAWKLAVACQRPDAAELITSYQSERRPNVVEYIATAVALGELINRMRTQGDAALGEQSNDGSIRMNSVSAGLGPGLGDRENPLCGLLVPQITLENGIRLDAKAGTNNLLMIRNGETAPLTDDNTVVVLADKDLAVRDLLDDFHADALFVRPDKRILSAASGPVAGEEVVTDARQARIVY
jgi:3-(3-hydroxy-phenyl)propionate hydroxylase